MTIKEIEELKKIFDEATDLNDFLLMDELDKEREGRGKRVYSNSELGQLVRAFISAKRIVEKAFKKVEKLREGNSSNH